MARLATTSDAFNAVAEPRRREIMEVLAEQGSLAVTDLVLKLGIPQPAVSKHLGVLRKVGLVDVVRHGKNRFYNLQPEKLKPVHEWVSHFEKFWTEHLQSIKTQAEQRVRQIQQKEKL
ncbi:MAG TPA: metalloregulator ArsR/SmtB family transcription factor [Tepidisphaeraceae bacterium]|nr:metalloregulator ArsR/SmtB family transcription factor [Tepidisphaeraceae bacterium]